MLQRIALCSAMSLLAFGPAQALTDPASGIEVNPPAPFIATVIPNAAAINAPQVVIASSTGMPEAVMGNRVVCAIRLRPIPNNATRTQEEINQLLATPQVIDLTKKALAAAFELGDATPFTVDGVAGLEFEGKMTVGPNPGVPSYLATMSTPRGSTTLTCATSAAEFRDAVRDFRAIRDSIRPPR